MGTKDKIVYDMLDRIYGHTDINFMNHGYSPADDRTLGTNLRNQKTLYLNLLESVDTDNKKILDIGCGRGGGTIVYKDYFNFKEIHGCEINLKNFEYCNRNTPGGIEYKLGDAENLDYPDNSFDIVSNVESSHSYTDMNNFLKEVYRVLVPGGVFAFTDIKTLTSHAIKQIGLFEDILEVDTTRNVADACKEDMEIFLKQNDSNANKLSAIRSKDYFNFYTVEGGEYVKIICRKAMV